MRRAHHSRRKPSARQPIRPRGPRWWHYLLVLLLALAAAAMALAALTHDYTAQALSSMLPASAFGTAGSLIPGTRV